MNVGSRSPGTRLTTMFRKPFSINNWNKVSGADRKKLRRGVEKQFASMSESDLELLLPSKSGELESAKLTAPSRSIIYLLCKLPVLVDVSGKGDLVPTVFSLWRVPELLPRVYVKHPAVSQFVINGADLMLPGVDIPAGGLPSFAKDDLVSICVHGNPAPVAVGVAGMSSADATAKAAQGLKGKLVELLMFYGDCLWGELGNKAVPNDGFLGHVVVPVGAGEQAASPDYPDARLAADDPAAAAAAAAENGTASTLDAPEVQSTQQLLEHLALNTSTATTGTAATAGAAGAAAGPASEPPDAVRGAASSSTAAAVPEDMDQLLEISLLQCLCKSVKDVDLPLNSSVLWNQHLLPMRPAGSSLDLKRSSHKKMSKFLQAYGGKNGLLTLKEDKKTGDTIVTAVNRQHHLLAEFRPLKASATAAGAAAAAGGAEAPGAGGATAGAAGSGGAATAELLVEEVYKPGRELRPVFEALGLRHDAVYSAAEAAEVAFSYVKAAKLEEGAPDPRTLVLDAALCDALFKGLIKKGEPYPTHLPKADLREAFLQRCQPQCRISRGTDSVLKKGAAPTVSVSAEKRQGHRITRITGIEAFLVEPDAVANECQRKYACSTTVNELPGKNQGYEIVIQGHVIEKLADHLAQTYHIPKKYFDVKK